MWDNMVRIVVLVSMVALVSACGSSGSSGGSDTTSSTPEISTVDQLPRATSPVVSSSASSISAAKNAEALKSAASTGIVLKDLSISTFASGHSMDLCQAANQTKDVISSAAMADLILCFVQNIVATDSTGTLADIYDGNYHIFGLNFQGAEGGAPDHVKMKIVKTGNVITGFEMFACSGGSQQEYLSQTISGNDVSIVSKGFYSSQNWAGAHQIDVNGTLNSSGYFTSKEMELDQYNGQSLDNPMQWSEATVAQYSDKMVFNGYDAGSYEGNAYGNRVYSEYQLIDTNTSQANDSYDIGKIAVGNGAAHGIFSHGEWNGEGSFGWNADTKLQDDTITIGSTGTTWVSLVQSTDPRAIVNTPPSISFEGSQVYDCSGAEDVQVTGNESELNSACSRFQLGHDWVDCYSVIQPDQQQ